MDVVDDIRKNGLFRNLKVSQNVTKYFDERMDLSCRLLYVRCALALGFLIM